MLITEGAIYETRNMLWNKNIFNENDIHREISDHYAEVQRIVGGFEKLEKAW